jgi:hypothetical protein
MLEFLADRASDRKLQLFGSACHRRIPAKAAIRWEQLRRGGNLPAVAGRRGVASNERKALVRAAVEAENAVAIVTCGINRKADKQVVAAEEREAQCTLVRDIFGNPFRPVAIEPSWLTWNDGTVVKVAQGIDEERAFGHLPLLADALEEAGCTDPGILEHLRGPGPHVRGCWVVDLLLGKE